MAMVAELAQRTSQQTARIGLNPHHVVQMAKIKIVPRRDHVPTNHH
jgi:hypothetical protein